MLLCFAHQQEFKIKDLEFVERYEHFRDLFDVLGQFQCAACPNLAAHVCGLALD
jgi:hypothetical protein